MRLALSKGPNWIGVSFTWGLKQNQFLNRCFLVSRIPDDGQSATAHKLCVFLYCFTFSYVILDILTRSDAWHPITTSCADSFQIVIIVFHLYGHSQSVNEDCYINKRRNVILEFWRKLLYLYVKKKKEIGQK
jgi:hypothetical protein